MEILAEAKRVSCLHTHQRVPQQPWFSPSPLTFSVFTDSVSLVGMLAVGGRKRFRGRTGGAARPGGASVRSATSRPSGDLGGGQWTSRSAEKPAPPRRGASAAISCPASPGPPQEEILSIQTFPEKSSLRIKQDPALRLVPAYSPGFQVYTEATKTSQDTLPAPAGGL